MTSNEMFRELPFPYPGGVFPKQLGAVVQKTVLSGEEPARLVIHTQDNSWLVGDGINDPNEPGACVATHIWHVIEKDRSVSHPVVGEDSVFEPGSQRPLRDALGL